MDIFSLGKVRSLNSSAGSIALGVPAVNGSVGPSVNVLLAITMSDMVPGDDTAGVGPKMNLFVANTMSSINYILKTKSFFLATVSVGLTETFAGSAFAVYLT